IYTALMISFVKNNGLQSYIRESFPIQKTGSVLLIVNYLISFSLLLFLIFDIKTTHYSSEMLAVLTVPIIFLAYHFFSILLIGWFSGEVDVIQTPLIIKINGVQFIGLGCSI